MSTFVHPTAIVENGVTFGEETSVWDSVHIRKNTSIGRSVIVGEKTHISYDVKIGNLVKINAFVYICNGVTIEDGVMISAGCVFTNDRYPRATDPDVRELRSSLPDEHTLETVVRIGSTLGAGCIIGPGLTIGRFAMVGMGSVVTSSVADYALVVGNPARCIGYVCRCGEPIIRKSQDAELRAGRCAVCHANYFYSPGQPIEFWLETSVAA